MSLPHTNPSLSLWNGPGRSADSSVTFRFPITWTTLLRPLGTAANLAVEHPPQTGIAQVSSSAFSGQPVRTAPVPSTPPSGGAVPQITASQERRPHPSHSFPTRENVASAVTGAQWEMVVPKMERPSLVTRSCSVPDSPVQDVPKAVSIASPAPIVDSTDVAAVVEHHELSAPSFGSALMSTPEPLSERLLSAVANGWAKASAQVKIALAGAILFIGGASWWLSSSAPAPQTIGKWVRGKEAFGVKDGADQKLVMFRTSPTGSDYRLDFEWKPDTRGVGWVFRSSRINRSFQAAHINLLPNHNPPTVALERYSVLASVEGPHSKKFIQLAGNAPSVPVRLDATGPAFNIYLEQRLADTWIDERFTEGEAGFVIDPEGLPGIGNLQLRFPNAPTLSGYQGTFQSLWNSLP